MSADLVSWLARLREITEVASRGIPVEEALGLVAATARELLPLDFCGVFTPNATRTALLLTGWDGLSRDYVQRINQTNPVGLGSEAPSSRAYFGGLPVVVTDIEAESGFEPWGGIAHDQGYTSMISVPLRSDRGILGTLNGYHARRHTYTADEIERLTLLANHAAAAIASAALVDDLRRSNEALVEQRDLLARSQAIREKLLQASLSSRGIDSVVSALQGIVRRPASYSSSTDPTAFAVEGRKALVTRPITIDGEVVGELTIWRDEVETPQDAHAEGIEEVAIGHAVAVLTLELLRQRAALDTEHRIAGELLQEVVNSGISEQALRRADAMGFDLTRLRVATTISISHQEQSDTTANANLQRGALVRLGRLRLEVDASRLRPLVAEYAGHIVAVWPDSVSDDVGDEIHASLSDAYPAAIVTVAASGLPRRTLGEAVRVAIGAHALAVRFAPGGAVRASELGYSGVLLHIDEPEVLGQHLHTQLGPVLEYDSLRGASLIRTLQSLVAHDFDRSATAEALQLHVNTVQQRVRRVEALLQKNLSSPRDLLDVVSALSIHSMLER
ncbi:MAG: GAF domain-containing protein [Microbacterium sp.]|nr:GAF domain-containing protein [Microbacterium sp.]